MILRWTGTHEVATGRQKIHPILTAFVSARSTDGLECSFAAAVVNALQELYGNAWNRLTRRIRDTPADGPSRNHVKDDIFNRLSGSLSQYGSRPPRRTLAILLPGETVASSNDSIRAGIEIRNDKPPLRIRCDH